MYLKVALLSLLACLPAGRALSDPIHAVADGAYWHHHSGWLFPEKLGDFARVGIPQDVAGSDDAVAHYARIENGTRDTAVVDVYRATSAAAGELEARSTEPSTDAAFPLSSPGLSGNRRVYTLGNSALVAVYFIDAGEWHVRIRITGPDLSTMDAFVREQHWDALTAH